MPSMLNPNIEELLIEGGATQGLLWELRYLLEGPSPDYVRFFEDELALYIFKNDPWHLYFVPMFEGPYRGMITRLNLTEHLRDMPLYLKEHGSILAVLNKALQYVQLPGGLTFHILSSLGLNNNLYVTRLELSVGWDGGEFITFVESGTGTWNMKTMHLDTLVSISQYLPVYVQEILISLLQCPLPLPEPVIEVGQAI